MAIFNQPNNVVLAGCFLSSAGPPITGLALQLTTIESYEKKK